MAYTTYSLSTRDIWKIIDLCDGNASVSDILKTASGELTRAILDTLLSDEETVQEHIYDIIDYCIWSNAFYRMPSNKYLEFARSFDEAEIFNPTKLDNNKLAKFVYKYLMENDGWYGNYRMSLLFVNEDAYNQYCNDSQELLRRVTGE